MILVIFAIILVWILVYTPDDFVSKTIFLCSGLCLILGAIIDLAFVVILGLILLLIAVFIKAITE